MTLLTLSTDNFSNSGDPFDSDNSDDSDDSDGSYNWNLATKEIIPNYSWRQLWKGLCLLAKFENFGLTSTVSETKSPI